MRRKMDWTLHRRNTMLPAIPPLHLRIQPTAYRIYRWSTLHVVLHDEDGGMDADGVWTYESDGVPTCPIEW